MSKNILNWIPIKDAVEQFGYYSNDNLNRRLRQLRNQGLVIDLGDPPDRYPAGDIPVKGKVSLLWANPRAFLIHKDAPEELLIAKRGKRVKTKNE